MKVTKRFVAASAAMLVAGVVQAAPCALTDATYSVNGPTSGPFTNATACFNGNGDNWAASNMNTAWGSMFGSGNFVEAAKIDGDGLANGPVTLFSGSFTFSLTDVSLTTNVGTYLLSATDNSTGAPDFPIWIDFALGLKAGSNESAAYLFDDVQFDGSGGGAWRVSFVNKKGNNPDLSNLTLFVREGTKPASNGGGTGSGSGGNVSAPGTLALAGLALFGVGLIRRRRAN